MGVFAKEEDLFQKWVTLVWCLERDSNPHDLTIRGF